MNIKIIWVLIIVAVGFPSVNWAGETKTELVLYKELWDSGALFFRGRTCNEVFTIKKDRNYSDLRDMRNYNCEGECISFSDCNGVCGGPLLNICVGFETNMQDSCLANDGFWSELGNDEC